MKKIKSALFAGAVLAVVFVSGSASALTTCQQNGHGGSCSMPDGSGGYCWSNTYSPTGYVCKEDKPSEKGQVVKGETATPVKTKSTTSTESK